jgi:hypothetical protein
MVNFKLVAAKPLGRINVCLHVSDSEPNQTIGKKKATVLLLDWSPGDLGGWNLELTGEVVHFIDRSRSRTPVRVHRSRPVGCEPVTGPWAPRGVWSEPPARDLPVPGPSGHVPAPARPRCSSRFLGAEAILPRTGTELYTRKALCVFGGR